MILKPKNWGDFQHYKDRSPAWVKLHKKLLDDYEFQRLPLASRALAPMLWLLASENLDGQFNADPDFLAFRLRCAVDEVVAGLKPLIDSGFFIVASGALAERKQDACLETEEETETEEEEESAGADAPAKPKRAKQRRRSTPIPDGFALSDAVKRWAAAKGYSRLDEHLDAFKRKAAAKDYRYADWDAAFMEAVRENWAKLPAAPSPKASAPGGGRRELGA